MTYSVLLILKSYEEWRKIIKVIENEIKSTFFLKGKRNFKKDLCQENFCSKQILGNFFDSLKKIHFTKAVFSHGKWFQLSFPEQQYVISHMQATAER